MHKDTTTGTWMWRFRVIGLVACVAGGSVPAMEPPPVSTYADPPALDHVRLSPNGDRILMLRPTEGARQLFVTDVETGKTVVAAEVDPKKQILRRCEWATNDRAVCQLFAFPRPPVTVVERPGGGVYPSTRVVRLFAVNHDGGDGIDLVQKPVGGTDWLQEGQSIKSSATCLTIRTTFSWRSHVGPSTTRGSTGRTSTGTGGPPLSALWKGSRHGPPTGGVKDSSASVATGGRGQRMAHRPSWSIPTARSAA